MGTTNFSQCPAHTAGTPRSSLLSRRLGEQQAEQWGQKPAAPAPHPPHPRPGKRDSDLNLPTASIHSFSLKPRLACSSLLSCVKQAFLKHSSDVHRLPGGYIKTSFWDFKPLVLWLFTLPCCPSCFLTCSTLCSVLVPNHTSPTSEWMPVTRHSLLPNLKC